MNKKLSAALDKATNQAGGERARAQRQPWLQNLLALLLYATATWAIVGRALLSRGFSWRLGECAPCDPDVYLWALAWFPHALRHALDPLFTRAVYAPGGYNLAWSTCIPGAALLMAPVTAVLGPLFSYNILTLAAPMAGAFATFVLCRLVTDTFWPSVAAGWLFGFSPFEQVQLPNHLHLALDFLPPLLLYLALKYWMERLPAFKFIAWTAILLVVQFSLSPEIFADTIVFSAIAFTVAYRMVEPRARVARLIRMSILALTLATLTLIPALAATASSGIGLLPVFNPAHCSVDLSNFFLPGVGWLSKWPALARPTQRLGCEPAGFMGLLPLIALLFLVGTGAHGPARLLVTMLAIVLAAALGPVVRFQGRAWLPGVGLLWLPFPLINNALPARFMLFSFLLLALILARWLAERRWELARWTIAAVALAMLLPGPQFSAVIKPYIPGFIANGDYRRLLAPGDTVLILPWGEDGQGTLWQATSAFYFRLAGGYLGAVTPAEYQRWPIVRALDRDGPYILDDGAQLRAFLSAHRVRAVVVSQPDYPPLAKLCAALGVAGRRLDGVLFFDLRNDQGSPAKPADAAAMDLRYNGARLAALLGAANRYLRSGRPLETLSASAATEAGLLSYDDVGDPAARQIPDLPLVGRILGWPAISRLTYALAGHGWLRSRLAAELRPGVTMALTTAGVWLGPWPGGRIAAGVICDPATARVLAGRYAHSAKSIFYPYPATYRDLGEAGRPHLLLLTFTPETVGALANQRSAAERRVAELLMEPDFRGFGLLRSGVTTHPHAVPGLPRHLSLHDKGLKSPCA